MKCRRFSLLGVLPLAIVLHPGPGTASESDEAAFSRAYAEALASVEQSAPDEVRLGLRSRVEQIASRASQLQSGSHKRRVATFERELLKSLQRRYCPLEAALTDLKSAARVSVEEAQARTPLKAATAFDRGVLSAFTAKLVEQRAARLCDADDLSQLAS